MGNGQILSNERLTTHNGPPPRGTHYCMRLARAREATGRYIYHDVLVLTLTAACLTGQYKIHILNRTIILLKRYRTLHAVATVFLKYFRRQMWTSVLPT